MTFDNKLFKYLFIILNVYFYFEKIINFLLYYLIPYIHLNLRIKSRQFKIEINNDIIIFFIFRPLGHRPGRGRFRPRPGVYSKNITRAVSILKENYHEENEPRGYFNEFYSIISN